MYMCNKFICRVCYLAGQLAKELRTKLAKELKKPENDIVTDKDILCVQIAGLCHDIGNSVPLIGF